MERKTVKIVLLFFICGLGFGLLTVFLAYLTPYIIWIGAGAVFLLGLAVSLIIARINGWILMPITTWRYFVAGVLTTGAYPLAFTVMIFGATGYNSLYQAIAPERWGERANSGDYPGINEGFLIGLALATVTSAILVSLTLWLLTRRWDRRTLALLVLAGILTIPLSGVIAALMDISNAQLILFPVGEALFGSLFGYGVQRAAKEDRAYNDAV